MDACSKRWFARSDRSGATSWRTVTAGFAAIVVLWMSLALRVGEARATEDPFYTVEFRIVYEDATASGPDRFRVIHAGSVGRAGTWGNYAELPGGNASIQVEVVTRNGMLEAKMTLAPPNDTSSARTESVVFEGMAPVSIELGRSAEKIVRLDMIPGIEMPEGDATQLESGVLQLDQWTFSASVVILDDEHYVGQIGGFGGPRAWVDIPGEARVTFALVPIQDSAPIGRFSNGRIEIDGPDGRRLDIHSVKCGSPAIDLPGHYLVHAIWAPPTRTRKEAAMRTGEALRKWTPDRDAEEIEEVVARVRTGYSLAHGVGGR